MKSVVRADVNAVMGLHGCGDLRRHEDTIAMMCGRDIGPARFDEATGVMAMLPGVSGEVGGAEKGLNNCWSDRRLYLEGI